MIKNELKINGIQNFMGINIPIIEGGFGENCRVVSGKSISDIHNIRLSDINASINRLITKNRIKEGIDYINLLSETVSLRELAKNLGMLSSNRTKDAFILSERGYTKLIKAMDDDSSWDTMDKFIDEYFAMREVINSDEQKKAKLLLMIYDGGQDAVLASKQLTEIEVKQATAPLIPKAKYHDAVETASNCVNFGKFSANLQNNEGAKLGRNTIMDWCRDKGYLCSSTALKNKPSQQMLSSGYMQYKQNVTERNGKTYINYTPLLTGKGEIWLTKQLLKEY